MKDESKKQKEKETPKRRICGQNAVMVKSGGKYMFCCPEIMNCSMRSRWMKKEEDAIKEWNTSVDEARDRLRAKKKGREKKC